MNNTVTYVVDYKSLAVLPFIVFLVVFIISLIRLKVKKKKPTVLWIISGVFLVGAIILFVIGNIFSTTNDSSPEEAKEHYRIAMNIQDNKLDHVLEDIDKLYPDDGNLDEMQKESRFILQLNYYIKSKDDGSEKKFLEKTVEDKEWLGYIEVVQERAKDEMKRLGIETQK